MSDQHDQQRIADYFLSDPTLRLLGEEACSALAGACVPVRFDEEDIVESSEGPLLILSGTATLCANGTGPTRTVKRVGCGDLCFPESILARNTFYPSGVVHTLQPDGPLAALRIPTEKIRTQIDQDRELAKLMRRSCNLGVHYFLSHAPESTRIDDAAVSAFLLGLKKHSFEAGDVLCRRGEKKRQFSVICAGRLRAEAKDTQSAPRLLRAGDSFGEVGLLLGTAEQQDVVATEDGYCVTLSGAMFDRLKQRNLALERFFARLVASSAAHGGAVSIPTVTELQIDLENEDPSVTVEPEPGSVEASLFEPAPQTMDRKLRKLLRRYPLRLQPEETDCGPACLGMVGDFYGRRLTHARLRELTSVSQQGSSFFSLAEAAEEIGFLARGVRVEGLAELRGIRLPAIAHVEGNHFVVIYEVTDRYLFHGNPSTGIERVAIEDFMEEWDGALLLLRPVNEGVETESPKFGLKRFLPYLRPHRKILVELLFAAIALQLLGLVIPFATQTVIDRVFVNGETALLTGLLLAIIGTAFFSSLLGALQDLLFYDVVRKADQALVSDFHHKLFRLPLSFFATRKVGDLLVRFTDNENVREFLTSVAFRVALDLVFGSVYLFVLFSFDPVLALIGLIPVPLLALLTFFVTPALRRLERRMAVQDGLAQTALVESLSGIVTVKGCCAESAERRRYEALFDNVLDTEVKTERLNTLSESIGSLIVACGQGLVLYVGAMHVLDGSLSVGTFVAFSFVLSQVLQPAENLLGVWEEFQDTAVSLERLGHVFDATPEEEDSLAELPRCEGHLILENVTFRYDRDMPPTVHGLNLEVLPGEHVAVVGRSGAGKTTLVHLALKLYSPDQGRILIDGYDLRTVSSRSLRRQVGFVPQQIELFSGTIAENIAVGRDLYRWEIVGAAMAAGIHDAITARPQGYETLVGESSMARFSGGELQRLAIARALAGGPRILILDEPTSALDAESESALLRTLEDTSEDRTVITLAHRLGVARRADRIIVIDEGRVAEQGTHEQLLALDGIYAMLHREQVG